MASQERLIKIKNYENSQTEGKIYPKNTEYTKNRNGKTYIIFTNNNWFRNWFIIERVVYNFHRFG